MNHNFFTPSLPQGFAANTTTAPEGLNLATHFEVKANNLNSITQIGRTLATFKRDMIVMGAKPKGPWDQMITYFTHFERRLNERLKHANKDVAQLYLEAVAHNWRNGLPWQPLSASYLADKVARGLDSRILIATGDALESLKMVSQKPGHIFVGVDVMSDGPRPFAYMVQNEFFDPKRPLFGPTLDQILPEAQRIYHKAVIDTCRGL